MDGHASKPLTPCDAPKIRRHKINGMPAWHGSGTKGWFENGRIFRSPSAISPQY